MAEETTPIPALAKSAIQFVAARAAEFQAGQNATVNQLGIETLEAMGLSRADGWTVDFDLGVAKRTVPDVPPADVPTA